MRCARCRPFPAAPSILPKSGWAIAHPAHTPLTPATYARYILFGFCIWKWQKVEFWHLFCHTFSNIFTFKIKSISLSWTKYLLFYFDIIMEFIHSHIFKKCLLLLLSLLTKLGVPILWHFPFLGNWGMVISKIQSDKEKRIMISCPISFQLAKNWSKMVKRNFAVRYNVTNFLLKRRKYHRPSERQKRYESK